MCTKFSEASHVECSGIRQKTFTWLKEVLFPDSLRHILRTFNLMCACTKDNKKKKKLQMVICCSLIMLKQFAQCSGKRAITRHNSFSGQQLFSPVQINHRCRNVRAEND